MLRKEGQSNSGTIYNLLSKQSTKRNKMRDSERGVQT